VVVVTTLAMALSHPYLTARSRSSAMRAT
jgi:hypothetical protein